MHLAVVGGSGVDVTDLLEDLDLRTVRTSYGDVDLEVGRRSGGEVAFLRRHGAGHTLPPHRVNYRANIAALNEIGVGRIIATAAVGGVAEHLTPGTLAVIDDFIDLTRDRASTYHDGGERGVVHLDVTRPYCDELRALLTRTGANRSLPVHDGGVYVCTEGPRFETAAEIAMIAGIGGDVVGMTGVPEVVLARELGLCYASIAMVTNVAAGLRSEPLSHGEVLEAQRANSANLATLLDAVLDRVPVERGCSCGPAPEPVSG